MPACEKLASLARVFATRQGSLARGIYDHFDAMSPGLIHLGGA